MDLIIQRLEVFSHVEVAVPSNPEMQALRNKLILILHEIAYWSYSYCTPLSYIIIRAYVAVFWKKSDIVYVSWKNGWDCSEDYWVRISY